MITHCVLPSVKPLNSTSCMIVALSPKMGASCTACQPICASAPRINAGSALADEGQEQFKSVTKKKDRPKPALVVTTCIPASTVAPPLCIFDT